MKKTNLLVLGLTAVLMVGCVTNSNKLSEEYIDIYKRPLNSEKGTKYVKDSIRLTEYQLDQIIGDGKSEVILMLTKPE